MQQLIHSQSAIQLNISIIHVHVVSYMNIHKLRTHYTTKSKKVYITSLGEFFFFWNHFRLRRFSSKFKVQSMYGYFPHTFAYGKQFMMGAAHYNMQQI